MAAIWSSSNVPQVLAGSITRKIHSGGVDPQYHVFPSHRLIAWRSFESCGSRQRPSLASAVDAAAGASRLRRLWLAQRTAVLLCFFSWLLVGAKSDYDEPTQAELESYMTCHNRIWICRHELSQICRGVTGRQSPAEEVTMRPRGYCRSRLMLSSCLSTVVFHYDIRTQMSEVPDTHTTCEAESDPLHAKSRPLE